MPTYRCLFAPNFEMPKPLDPFPLPPVPVGVLPTPLMVFPPIVLRSGAGPGREGPPFRYCWLCGLENIFGVGWYLVMGW